MAELFDVPVVTNVAIRPYITKFTRSYDVRRHLRIAFASVQSSSSTTNPPKGKHTTVLVAISGGKDSAVLLERIHENLGKRRDVTIVGGCVDEGIEGYRPPSLECARELCENLGIRFETVSYPELGFKEMDEVVEKIVSLDEKKAPCSYCGVFRRQGINHLAERVGADVIALGHNLDDMAQTIMMNMQNGDLERTLRLAPHTSTPLEGMVPRIVPLRWIPEQEIHLYALHRGLPIHHEECPHGEGALRFRHRETVAMMEADVPGTRRGLLRMADDVKKLHAMADGGFRNQKRSIALSAAKFVVVRSVKPVK